MSSGNGVAGLPLASLRVFDAAARHLNMGRAAAELGITQGAVSRQIKVLEDRLQEALFRRGPRGLRLTEAGDLLADYVPDGATSTIVDGRVRTTVRVSHYHGLKRLIASMPGVATVVAPPEARAVVAEWAAAGADRYR